MDFKTKLIPLAMLGILLVGIGCIGPFAEEEDSTVPDDETPDEETYEDLEERLETLENTLDSVLMELEDLNLENFTVDDEL